MPVCLQSRIIYNGRRREQQARAKQHPDINAVTSPVSIPVNKAHATRRMLKSFTAQKIQK